MRLAREGSLVLRWFYDELQAGDLVIEKAQEHM